MENTGIRRILPVSAAVALATAVPAHAQVWPQRGLFDESTGLIRAEVGSGMFRGSGVVARDPRLIYSCAHVLYENGVWAHSYRFFRAWHGASPPSYDSGAAPRGFRYFTSYSSNASTYGGSSEQAYAYDFVVLYGESGFGTAVGWWHDGGAVLRSNRWKRIIGYPATIAATGADGFYYQHGTDWFDNVSQQGSGAYHWARGVSTGSGNSGGPVFVWDADSETQYLAGILVSGDTNLYGAHALGEATHQMASNALGLEMTTKRFVNKSAKKIPDNRKRYTTRKVTVKGFGDRVSKLKCALDIRTPRRGDLDVYLKSPTGRVAWLNKKSANRSRNLVLRNKDLSGSFSGYTANGKWALKMRDVKRGKKAKFQKLQLKVTALAE